MDAGHQLAWIERLRQVVVRAELQPDDAIDLVAARSQHDDRRRVVGAAQLAADREPVLAGQHQVEHQQVEAFARPQLVHRGGVFREEHVEALLGEIASQQIAKSLIVVDDEDLVLDRSSHGCMVMRRLADCHAGRRYAPQKRLPNMTGRSTVHSRIDATDSPRDTKRYKARRRSTAFVCRRLPPNIAGDLDDRAGRWRGLASERIDPPSVPSSRPSMSRLPSTSSIRFRRTLLGLIACAVLVPAAYARGGGGGGEHGRRGMMVRAPAEQRGLRQMERAQRAGMRGPQQREAPAAARDTPASQGAPVQPAAPAPVEPAAVERPARPGRLTPDERKALRQQINDAGRDVYRPGL